MSPGGWLCIGLVLRRCLFEIPDNIKDKKKVVKELLAAPSCSCRPPSARAGVKRAWRARRLSIVGQPGAQAHVRADRSLVDDALVEP
jgi:hypothetical protein|eukprot:COSAG06_NODE_5062_length_3753_cov_39.218938_1_plen_87_part_00